MLRLLIIGAGGFGREVFEWAKHLHPTNPDWQVAGFLDENAKALETYGNPAKIFGDPKTYQPEPEDRFVCAIGDPKIKLGLCRNIEKRGGRFLSIVHPEAVVGSRNQVGEGAILCPGAVVTCDVKIGRFVTLNVHCCVGHDAIIGDGCTLSPHSDVNGFARLGEAVFLGSHAAVLPSAVVGDRATVGAGSIVLKKVKPGATVVGVPAKQVTGFEG